MTAIARDEDSRGDLIAWYESDEELSGPVQLTCAVNEVAVIVIGGEAAHELSAGRHQLTADSHEGLEDWLDGGDDAVDIAFLTISRVTLEVHGDFARGEDEAYFDATAVVEVTDASAVIGLLENLGDDESLEGWLADEVAVHVNAAIESMAAKPLLDLTSGAYNEDLEALALKAANEVLEPSGVTVASVRITEVELEEATRKRVGGELARAEYARIAREENAKLGPGGALYRECPSGHGWVQAPVCPACKAATRLPA